MADTTLTDALASVDEITLIDFYKTARAYTETLGCPDCTAEPHPELANVWRVIAASAHAALAAQL